MFLVSICHLYISFYRITLNVHIFNVFSILSHIFLPVMDALVHVASHLKGKEQQLDFLQRVLQSFIQQGIEGKKASERKEVLYSLKASSSSFSLGLLLPVLATV